MHPKQSSSATRLHYLASLYEHSNGYFIPREDEQAIRQAKGASLYGEITQSSLARLIKYLKLTPRDVFYDLGSGLGKVVLQVAMTTKIHSATGIELSHIRHLYAGTALHKVKEARYLATTQCKFIHGDILKEPLPGASIIYTCSTAFSQKLMAALSKRLRSILAPGTRIVSLQDFNDHKQLELVDVLKLEMTWDKKCPVHIYEIRS
jgi:SAM-dependent methyltransferase